FSGSRSRRTSAAFETSTAQGPPRSRRFREQRRTCSPCSDGDLTHSPRPWAIPLFAHSGRLESTQSGHPRIVTQTPPLGGSGHSRRTYRPRILTVLGDRLRRPRPILAHRSAVTKWRRAAVIPRGLR